MNEHQTRAEIDKVSVALVNNESMKCADGEMRNPMELASYRSKLQKPYFSGRGGVDKLTKRANEAVIKTIKTK